jgi:hypothetical protein
VFSKSAIDRGIFRVDSLKKYHSEVVKNPSTSQDDIFTKPDPNKVTGMKQGNYSKLNERGYVPEETEIKNNDIIVGKVSPIQPTGNNNKVFKDSSELFKSNITGVVDRVHTGIHNSEGYEMINVRIRMERIPIIGDKFCLTSDRCDVLTYNGWINIKDVTINHKVAILVNDTLVYEQPQEIHCFAYDSEEDGKLYQVKNEFVELTVTPNHRMYVKEKDNFNFVFAKDCFGKKLKYKKSVNNYQPSDWIDKEYIFKNNIESLPDWVWNLNKKQSILAIESIVGKDSLNTTKKLADDLSRLCLHAGWTSKITKINDDVFYITIIKDNLEPETISDNESWVDYKGTVHCLTVRTGIFMVRENGKPVWTGNSNRHG